MSRNLELQEEFKQYLTAVRANKNFDPEAFYEKISKFLSDGIDQELKTDEGDCLLVVAAAKGATKLIRLLMKRGINVNQKGIDRKTALIEAAANGHGEIVDVLLNKDAMVEIKDLNNLNALTAAIDAGHDRAARSIAQALATNGIEYETEDEFNAILDLCYHNVALHRAAIAKASKKFKSKISVKHIEKLAREGKHGALYSALVALGTNIDPRTIAALHNQPGVSQQVQQVLCEHLARTGNNSLIFSLNNKLLIDEKVRAPQPVERDNSKNQTRGF
jgi:hypothetical protein